MNKLSENIADKFRRLNRTLISVEFFPPKTEEGARQILATAESVREIMPDYVSITYGAGGSTRDLSMRYGEILKNDYAFDVLPHLTCVGHSKSEIAEILEKLKDAGFKNIMALRGDPPKGDKNFVPHPDGFAHASELISFIKSRYPDFSVGCAGYPERHPEAASFDEDISWLRHKIDCGADFVVTQMFFDNAIFYSFRDKCLKAGIDKPIIAGVLPALSAKQLSNFSTMCNTFLPEELVSKMASAKDSEDSLKVGADWAQGQVVDLIKNRAAGVHMYILNRAHCVLQLVRAARAASAGL